MSLPLLLLLCWRCRFGRVRKEESQWVMISLTAHPRAIGSFRQEMFYFYVFFVAPPPKAF